jgi:hypothetical protein
MTLLTWEEIESPKDLNLESRTTGDLLDIRTQLKKVESDILTHRGDIPINIAVVKFTHARILEILSARGFDSLEQLLPIRSSGELAQLDKIEEGEVVEYLDRSAILIPEYVTLVGSICNLGETERDIDIAIRSSMRDKETEFRVMRALPKEWATRLHFHYRSEEDFGAPITSYVPLFDKRLVPCLDKGKNELASKENVRKSKIDDYKLSIKRNSIGIGRYFLPLRSSLSPIRANRTTEMYNVKHIELWLKYIHENQESADRPIIGIQTKFGGSRIILHKIGKNAIFFTETGKDVTNHFPTIRKEVLELDADNLILDAECDYWKDGKHRGRAWTNSWLNRYDEDDSNVVLNVFDCLYYDSSDKVKRLSSLLMGDVHKLPLSERLKYLDILHFKQSTIKTPGVASLNRLPILVARDNIELRAYDKKCCDAIGSEGAIIKWMGGDYPLTGMTKTWIDHKNYAQINVIILKKSTTKVQKRWSYLMGLSFEPGTKIHPDHVVQLSGKKYVECGDTSKTNITFKPGDVATKTFHALTEFTGSEGMFIHSYEPFLIKKGQDQALPASIEAAIETAKEAGCYNREEVNKPGKEK